MSGGTASHQLIADGLAYLDVLEAGAEEKRANEGGRAPSDVGRVRSRTAIGLEVWYLRVSCGVGA